jgi:hypothetical protein
MRKNRVLLKNYQIKVAKEGQTSYLYAIGMENSYNYCTTQLL